jgi:hypothetical protein
MIVYIHWQGRLLEDTSQPTLEKYLPQVRSTIITWLLQGLRGKQNQFREIVSNSRPKSSGHSRTSGGLSDASLMGSFSLN